MGAIDINTKIYFQNRDHFADLFNFKLYDGRQQIHAADLKPVDSAVVIAPYGNHARQPIQRIRDNVSMWASMQDDHSAYIILGIESQTNVHYAMPVRNMVYDSSNYAEQIQRASVSYSDKKKERSEQFKLSNSEFLSGFRKEDRLIPVITIVLLFNADTWDGPRSIHEMLSIHDAGLLKYIPDYRINLVAPAELQENEYRKFHTPLGQVLEYIRVSRDKDKLDQLMKKDSRYSRMDRDSANLINAVTNSKLTYPEEGDEIDMCKAIDDMRADAKAEGIEEGRAEGRAVGIEEGRAEGKTESLVSSIKNVMDSIHVSIEEAMDILKVDPQKRQEYAARVK